MVIFLGLDLFIVLIVSRLLVFRMQRSALNKSGCTCLPSKISFLCLYLVANRNINTAPRKYVFLRMLPDGAGSGFYLFLDRSSH